MLDHKSKNYALNKVKATSADKGAVRNRALLDGVCNGVSDGEQNG